MSQLLHGLDNHISLSLPQYPYLHIFPIMRNLIEIQIIFRHYRLSWILFLIRCAYTKSHIDLLYNILTKSPFAYQMHVHTTVHCDHSVCLRVNLELYELFAEKLLCWSRNKHVLFSVAIQGDGSIVGRYAKIHSIWGESPVEDRSF